MTNKKETAIWSAKHKLVKKVTALGLFTLILIFANLSISAQDAPPCPLVISNVTGDLSNFNVANFDETTISISIPGNTVGVWGTLQVAMQNNTNINISPVPLGTKNPVFVTASKVDSALPAGFRLVGTDSVGHAVVIDAIVDCPHPPQGCTRTQGYWKNKPDTWAVNSLLLGNVSYTKAELLSIFNRSVKGNGLVSLSHQLIAAKLNKAAGVSVPTDVETAMMAADALIGDLVVPPVGSGYLRPSVTSSLTSTLDSYNNGEFPGGPPHCDD